MASTVHSLFALIDHAIVGLNSPHRQADSDWLDEYFSLVPPFPWHHGLRRGLRHNQEHSVVADNRMNFETIIVDLFGCLIANIRRTAKNPYAIIANRLTNWNGKTVNNQELSA